MTRTVPPRAFFANLLRKLPHETVCISTSRAGKKPYGLSETDTNPRSVTDLTDFIARN